MGYNFAHKASSISTLWVSQSSEVWGGALGFRGLGGLESTFLN